jgi:hypothetical protein
LGRAVLPSYGRARCFGIKDDVENKKVKEKKSNAGRNKKIEDSNPFLAE